MNQLPQRFIQVSIDQNEDGLSIQSWWGVDRPPRWELLSYPHQYTYYGDVCEWVIFASGELTPVLLHTIGEAADSVCLRARKINANRKLANR